MGDIVYLNGQYMAADQAKVSIFDRGFLFADSLYEVIPFYNGVGFRLQEHLDRLQHGMRAVRIGLEADLAAICVELVARNGGGHQAVYIQVTRGAESRRRQACDPALAPTLLLFSYPIEVALGGDLDAVQGISVITTEDLRWRRCDIKATGLLSNIMALQQALDAGAQEALMVRDGQLTEGSSSNLFVINDGLIQTPARSQFILGGTTRSLILELAREQGIPCLETTLAEQRLAQADEVWISSSTRGVVPVVRINGELLGDGRPGPLWRRMAELYREFERRVVGLRS